MKTMIITSLLALSTGLTGVLGAPVAIVNSDLTTRGDLKYGSVASGGNDAISVAARNEDYCDDNPLCYPTPLPPKEKRDEDPYWCGAPFCGPKPDVAATLGAVADVLDIAHGRDPHWCGAGLCGPKPEGKRDVNFAPVEDVITERDSERKHKPKKHADPYWCGAPFCGPKPVKAVRELDFSPTEKRGEEITKCWEAADGQIHCQYASDLSKRSESIVKCTQGPEGQVHCDNPPYPPRSVADLTEKRSESIVKCTQGPEGQVHCDNPPYPPRSIADLTKRGDEIVKCTQGPEGQVHCDNPPYPPRSIKLNEHAKGITKCWEAPDGQIHCQAFKREAESVDDINE